MLSVSSTSGAVVLTADLPTSRVLLQTLPYGGVCTSSGESAFFDIDPISLTACLRSRDRRFLIIPFFGFLSFVVGATYFMVLDVIRASRGLTDYESAQYVRCTEAMLTIDLILTWLVTLMIIWKLWHVGRRVMPSTDRKENRYLAIILALVESGMLYSVVVGAFVIIWYCALVRRRHRHGRRTYVNVFASCSTPSARFSSVR